MSNSGLETFVRYEQTNLWTELNTAIDWANNREWSMQCDWITQRIVHAIRLVGPTQHGELPWPLVCGGVYAAVLARAGIVWEGLPELEWVRLEVLMTDHGGWTRVNAVPRFAVAVESVGRAWIEDSGDDEGTVG